MAVVLQQFWYVRRGRCTVFVNLLVGFTVFQKRNRLFISQFIQILVEHFKIFTCRAITSRFADDKNNEFNSDIEIELNKSRDKVV